MAYLYKLCVVINDEEYDPTINSALEGKIDSALSKIDGIEVVGATIGELPLEFCGKCCVCGTWVSDHEKNLHIDGFSDGCMIEEKWWCDLCLPSDHPKHF